MKKYYSNDPKFESDIAYTRQEMMALYRGQGWDKLPEGQKMTNNEILAEIGSHGVKEAE